ncbi:MAG TPA: hypothetical protein VFT04_00645 [Gemmatimonadales bacterium]|nr:hypothetical protein [Gemmatimonadales bacterium]
MRRTLTLLFLVLGAACAGETPTDESGLSMATAGADEPREALARRFARALADPAFRTEVHAALAASTHPEGKIHLGRFLRAEDARAARTIGAAPDEVRRADRLEVYLPVPAHRAAWNGGSSLLVGTIGGDSERPVGFDIRGQRLDLDPGAPPAVPVLAVVPIETDFGREAARVDAAKACLDCEDEGGVGSGGGGSTITPGLHLRASHLNESFESWLKGQPEIEVLVLGQKGASDSLTSYQCAGNFAPGAYYFDQNSLDWSGSALIMSQIQLDAYEAQHPGQAVRLFFMEDDDTPCEIRANNTDLRQLLTTVDSLVRGFSGGHDEETATGRAFRFFTAAQKIVSVVASAIKTNDDLIGNAVEDVTTSERYAGYNWILKGATGRTNGYVKLEMR